MFTNLPLGSSSAKSLCFILFIFVLTCCDEDETYVVTNRTAFTFYAIEEAHEGSRFSGHSTPVYLVVSIDDRNQESVVSNKKLAVHRNGEQFVSDHLELTSGAYTLTKFIVLDSAYNAVYASPKEDSELSRFASVRLPLNFSVQENATSSVAAQVLAVSENSPGQFGYQEFDFEIGDPPAPTLIDLPVKLLFAQNDSTSYDSVFISFFDLDKVLLKQQRLTLNTLANVATDTVKDLSNGVRVVEIKYFRTLTARRQSEVHTGTGTITLTSSTAELLTDGYTLYLTDGLDVQPKVVMRTEGYYIYYFFDNESLNAAITLPVDPLNPKFEISLIKSSWDYFYADRTFYDTRPNEPGSNYLQGTAAFEKYNDRGKPIDFQDTTSFKMLTMSMQNRDWDLADCLVIFYIDGVEQPILYHQWHNKIPVAGRKISTNISRDEIDARRRSNFGLGPARIFQRHDVLHGD